MNLQPILDAPDAIQIHLATVGLAMLATVAILIAKKGTSFHKAAGWLWATMMMTTALVSFCLEKSTSMVLSCSVLRRRTKCVAERRSPGRGGGVTAIAW